MNSLWLGICSVCERGRFIVVLLRGLGSDTIAPARPSWHQLWPKALGFWEENIDWGDGWSDWEVGWMRELQGDGCVGTWLCGFWLGAGAVSSNIDAWPWIILCLGSCLLPDSSQQSLGYLFICFHNLSKNSHAREKNYLTRFKNEADLEYLMNRYFFRYRHYDSNVSLGVVPKFWQNT